MRANLQEEHGEVMVELQSLVALQDPATGRFAQRAGEGGGASPPVRQRQGGPERAAQRGGPLLIQPPERRAAGCRSPRGKKPGPPGISLPPRGPRAISPAERCGT